MAKAFAAIDPASDGRYGDTVAQQLTKAVHGVLLAVGVERGSSMMRVTPSLCALVLIVGLGTVPPAWAQVAATDAGVAEGARQHLLPLPTATADDAGVRPDMPPLPLPALRQDLRRFFSSDTLQTLAPLGIAAMAVSPWDRQSVAEVHEHLPRPVFEPGNLGGQFLVHAGASASMWAIGRATNRPGLAWLGSDILRAQFLSQGIVQGVKFATNRPRPDGSNRQSFPSGHAATAFATASVLHQHYGWKAGLPAYAFGAYVGASRMSGNRHHLSDVLVGAAVGMVAGRTVTVGMRGQRFSLGVAPSPGGAAITFTRQTPP
jgi:membrane-associated phospholipid phosphatase